MRIVQIVSQMEAGGAQKVASLLTEGFRQRGHDAQLWFLYKKRPAFELNSYTSCLYPRRPPPAVWCLTAARVWKKLRDLQPDVVLTHTHSANVFAAPIAAMAGVPVRVAVHHNPVETYSRLTRTFDKYAFSMGSYSEMIAVSGGVRQSFSDHSSRYNKRLHRIYNGIDTAGEIDTGDIRAHYRIPGRHALLVNVGRLAKQKNQGLLLEMLMQIPEATLMLIGDGELGIELRSKAASLGVSDRVRFTGELPGDKVAAILRQADLFLLPSRYEAFCLAAVEAMHHGVAVVASDLPCLREVLGDGQLFFPVDNSEKLSEIVNRLLISPLERAVMVRAGKMRAENFSVDRMVGEYELLLAEALLYVHPRKSATNNFRRIDALGSVARVHDQL
jgi:glycosyltransferase involved in cell wall biosynthesis